MSNHYHENYGFDLEATLGKYPIKELNTPKYKDDLINSLKKGNIQSATFVKDGKETKQYIEANPQFKAITIYDSAMKRMDTRQRNAEQQGVDKTQENKQGQDTIERKQSRQENAQVDSEDATENKKTNKRRKSQSM